MQKIISTLSILLLLSIASVGQIQPQIKKFTRMLDLLDKYYVDSIDAEKLVETAITAMLKDLDPHTVYITKDEVKSLNEPLQGSFDGIGIQFNILFDTLMVITPISGGPSEKVGIRSGDRIISVEGENIAGIGITTKDVRKKLLGKKGSVVKVGVKRRGIDEILEFSITRDKIPIYSVDAAYMIDRRDGYIKLNKFSKTTMDEFRKALAGLQEKGMKNLILDLEGNGGGYLNMAVELADEFLTDKKLIVYTEGSKSKKDNKLATKKGDFEKGRLCLLINEGTASASEIVSGAIQDWDRGVLIGRLSYGKGLVQRQYYLPDGSATRVTIAHYYTPTGRSIQRPYNKGVDEYRNDLRERMSRGELTNQDSIHFADSLKYETLVSKRIVYGGGGIMPDIFVPLDTISYTDYYRDIIIKGVLSNFVLDKIDKNRELFKTKYPTFESFDSNFIVDSTLINELVKKASSEGIEENTEELNLAYDRLKIHIKALFARDLYSNQEYFIIINRLDPAFKTAYELIRNKKKYNSILNP